MSQQRTRKLWNVLLLCLFCVSFVVSDDKIDQGTSNNGARIRRRLRQSEPCVVLVEARAIRNDEGREDSEVHTHHHKKRFVCALQGSDATEAGWMIVSIKGDIEEQELEEHVGHQKIGKKTTLRVSGAEIDRNTGTLIVPSNTTHEYQTIETEGQQEQGTFATGNSQSRKVLALRVRAKDNEPSYGNAFLRDEVFGTGSDEVNLSERYNSCSYGQVQMVPYDGTTTTGKTISQGTAQVYVNVNAEGRSDDDLVNRALNVAEDKYGDLPSQFDHVMLCLPPGTAGNWIAYAYVDHWLSVYNDEWCTYPSAQVHEVGHNLGLAHSGEAGLEYGDQTGLMGLSYSSDDYPKMCFTPAKSWQLGWYSDERTTVNVAQDGPFTASLRGIADYDFAGGNGLVHLKIENGSVDYYIGFNRATGINSDVVEAKNKVTIQKQGQGYSNSKLIAKLKANEKKRLPMKDGGDLILRVLEINDRANIEIVLRDCFLGNICGPECGEGSCDTPERIFFEGFENGFGKFNSPGDNYVKIDSRIVRRGTGSLRITGNSSNSRAFTDSISVSGASNLKVIFYLYSNSKVQNGEGVSLQYAANDGSFQFAWRYKKGRDFAKNKTWYKLTLELTAPSDTIKFQFVGKTAQGKFYIDDVQVQSQ